MSTCAVLCFWALGHEGVSLGLTGEAEYCAHVLHSTLSAETASSSGLCLLGRGEVCFYGKEQGARAPCTGS